MVMKSFTSSSQTMAETHAPLRSILNFRDVGAFVNSATGKQYLSKVYEANVANVGIEA